MEGAGSGGWELQLRGDDLSDSTGLINSYRREADAEPCHQRRGDAGETGGFVVAVRILRNFDGHPSR